MGGVDFTAAYEDRAIYLPSLQQSYAAFAQRDQRSLKPNEAPKGFQFADLNYLNPNSSLWHCKYALYSSGQFSSSTISPPDIVSMRSADTVVIGDSGGFQIGTGKLAAVKDWIKFRNKPEAIFRRWMRERSVRDSILRWLDCYSDYAMTLDMPLWVVTETKAKSSPFAKLSAQQLIDLTVENLRYFANKRGAATGARAKYLNVLQDVGGGTGEAWYAAVKDFAFEGWSFGGDTKSGLEPIIKWIRILLDDKKLDKAEWIHILMASPPVHSVYLTQIQRQLRKMLGTGIQISYDSSSPFQSAGKHHNIAVQPKLGKSMSSWKISMSTFAHNPKYFRQDTIEYLTAHPSPVTQRFSINDLHSERGEFAQTFLSTAGVQLLINHNMYVYHQAAKDACDIVFLQGDSSRIPAEVERNLEVISRALS